MYFWAFFLQFVSNTLNFIYCHYILYIIKKILILYIKNIIKCHLLFLRYQCPFCYATGENAHTRRYCPKNPNKMCFIKGEQIVVKQNLQ